MEVQTFTVVGISVRTTNENGQSGKDIPALWEKFMKEGIAAQIPNKVDNTVYCIYTEYEKDYTLPYTTILGCKVYAVEELPEGMKACRIETADYKQYTAKGDIWQGSVYNEWVGIWNGGLQRAYTADFEVYGSRAADPHNAEVDIFVAVP